MDGANCTSTKEAGIVEGDGLLIGINSGFMGNTNGIRVKGSGFAYLANCTLTGYDENYYDIIGETDSYIVMNSDNELYNNTRQILGTLELRSNTDYLKNNSDLTGDTLTDALNSQTDFVSTEQTGTGSSQNIAHGLGRTPTKVLLCVTDNNSGNFVLTEGTHDGTNVKATVTSGVKFKVYAK